MSQVTAPEPSTHSAEPSRFVFFWLALLFLFFGAMIVRVVWKRTHAPAAVESVADDSGLPRGELLKEYELTERSGKTFHSSALAGKVHVGSFFYTNCPTICRQLNTAKARLAREYGPKGVTFVSITCDPSNDTPGRLSEYARFFDADPEHWLFLTGKLTYIRRVGSDIYQVPVSYDGEPLHSEKYVVIDKWGEIRGTFNFKHADQMEAMRKLLDELLAEQEPPVKESPKKAPPDSDDGE